MRRWPTNPHVLSLATRNSVLLFDIRGRYPVRRLTPRSIKPPCFSGSYNGCVRSLNYCGSVLSYGTSIGNVYFYDLVADAHLPNYFDCQNMTKKLADSKENHTGGHAEDEESNRNLADLMTSSEPSDYFTSNSSSQSNSDFHSRWNSNDLNLANFIDSLPNFQSIRQMNLPAPLRITLRNLQSFSPTVEVSSDSDDLQDLDQSLPPVMPSSDAYPSTSGTRITHAVYTHEYDPTGTRLFTAGGHIAISHSESFAVLWE